MNPNSAEIIEAMKQIILASPYPESELHIRAIAKESNAYNTYWHASHQGQYGFGATPAEAYLELSNKLGDPKKLALEKVKEARALLEAANKLAPNKAVDEALFNLP